MYCANCDTQSAKDAQFCISCGKKLTADEAVTKELPPSTDPANLENLARARPEPEPTSKKRTILPQVRRGLRIAALIILWVAVPMFYALLAIAIYTKVGSDPTTVLDPNVRRSLAALNFWTIFGVGFLCALHMKRRKSLWFFVGSVGGWILGLIISLLVGAARAV